METHSAATTKEKNAIEQWQQGDVVLDAGLLGQVLETSLRMADMSGKSIQGLIVVSQTCDILKGQMPNVQLCAVVKCQDAQQVEAIKKRKQIRYAYIPSFASSLLVADLSITIPLSKTSLARVDRHDGGFDHDGMNSDESIWIARFQGALSRSVARFAFPDNFNPFKMALKEQLDKLKKATDTKKGIQAIDEILATVVLDPHSKQVTSTMIWLLLESVHSIEDHEFGPLNKAINEALIKVRGKLEASIKNNGANPNTLFPTKFRFREPADTTVEEYKTMHEIDFDDVS